MPTLNAADGCRIYYEVDGDGPPLMLIPGLGGSADFWSDVARHLTPHFRVISFDHRGTGRSDRPLGQYCIEQIARDTIAILDEAGIERAHLAGHSTGGVIAQVIALDHVARVDRLVISGSWATFDARMALLFEARAEILSTAGPSVYQKLTHAMGFPAEWISAHLDELDKAMADAPSNLAPIDVTLARLGMLARTDRYHELGGIHARTLIIGAPDDPIVPFYQSELLAGAIPGARLQPFAGSHFFPRVDPRCFAGLLRDFLQATDD